MKKTPKTYIVESYDQDTDITTVVFTSTKLKEAIDFLCDNDGKYPGLSQTEA
jgi:hypothetical protein